MVYEKRHNIDMCMKAFGNCDGNLLGKKNVKTK